MGVDRFDGARVYPSWDWFWSNRLTADELEFLAGVAAEYPKGHGAPFGFGPMNVTKYDEAVRAWTLGCGCPAAELAGRRGMERRTEDDHDFSDHKEILVHAFNEIKAAFDAATRLPYVATLDSDPALVAWAFRTMAEAVRGVEAFPGAFAPATLSLFPEEPDAVSA